MDKLTINKQRVEEVLNSIEEEFFENPADNPEIVKKYIFRKLGLPMNNKVLNRLWTNCIDLTEETGGYDGSAGPDYAGEEFCRRLLDYLNLREVFA